MQLWGQADISAVVPGVQWCAVQIWALADLQCSGARVSTQAQCVCSVWLLSHCHVEQWSCTFTPPYTFMVWCLMTEGHLTCYVTVRICEDVDWVYLVNSGLQCQAYVHVVVNTEFL